MVPDWQTNMVYFSRLLPKRFPNLWWELEATLKGHRVPVKLLEHTRDIWARDYCPVQGGPGRWVKFRFDPDYLRDYEHLITTEEVLEQLEHLGQIRMSPIVLDGGNVVGSGRKAILTNKVFQENPDYPKARLRAELERLLEVEECIFIPMEKNDLFGHADGMVRFITPHLVVMNDYTEIRPSLHQEIRRIFKRHHLDVELLPYPPPRTFSFLGVPRKDSPTLSAEGNYVNFLWVGNLIILPTYGIPEDEMARRILERLCPNAKIIPLSARELAEEGGVFHSISWTLQVGLS